MTPPGNERRIALLLVSMAAIPVVWTIWATTVTSSTFALLGGSEAVARVARHPASLRWLIGVLMVVLVVWLQWRAVCRGCGATRTALRLVVLQLVAVVLVGSLNWALIYDPARNALRSFWGGIQVNQGTLGLSADGPCVTSLEVHGAKLTVDDDTYRLRRLPLPLEDESLVDYLRQIRCPDDTAAETGE